MSSKPSGMTIVTASGDKGRMAFLDGTREPPRNQENPQKAKASQRGYRMLGLVLGERKWWLRL